mmetsp:Transcript_14237/g.22413  ORF Transcript_14237/g.22413 Transcript_14237/m.22413 type:complete len:96 (+) Transcript_14237:1072-1359(+)
MPYIVISGAFISCSGCNVTLVVCDAMNRSLSNVLQGDFWRWRVAMWPRRSMPSPNWPPNFERGASMSSWLYPVAGRLPGRTFSLLKQRFRTIRYL